MVITGLVFVAVAALVHVYIFYLESVVWTGPKARAVFGLRSVEEAETTRALAFNQGFYNLFLAVLAAGGIAAFVAGERTVGGTLIFAGAGSMVAASLVLLISSPDKASSALNQGVAPLIGLVALTLGLVL